MKQPVLVIDIGGGVLQDVYKIVRGKRVPVDHALLDWDMLTGDGSSQDETAARWQLLPEVVRDYIRRTDPDSFATVQGIINPPPPPKPTPGTLAEAASDALAVLEYTLTDCADDDRGRMEPAAKRLRAALERETNRAGDLDK